MNSASLKSVRVDQLLFGYDQGHRLIAGSVIPSASLKRQLSRISDSPGGSPSYPKGSVLRGVPILDSKAYALMRTWPARQSRARPGTVWTHAFLIGLPDLGRDGIVAQLVARLQNPEQTEDFTVFDLPIMIAESTYYPSPSQISDIDSSLAKALLSQLYGDPGAPLRLNVRNDQSLFAEDVSFSKIEDLVISLWEQQWPRLRRGFSFMVGPWFGFDQNSLFKSHDLVIGFIRSPFMLSPEEAVSTTSWLNKLVEDLQNPGMLRRFLKRAGADIDNPLRATRLLVELYVLYSVPSWSKSVYQEIFDKTFAAFPEKNDAKWLKEQLVDYTYWAKLRSFKINEYIEALFEQSRAYELPPLATNLSGAVQRLLIESPEEAQHLALHAFGEDDLPLAENFIELYLASAHDKQLGNLVMARPALIHALIQRNPALLEREVLWQVLPERRDSTLARLLTLPENMRSGLDWNAITSHLLSTSNQGLSHDLIRQLPDQIISLLLGILQQKGDPNLNKAWMPALNARAEVVIDWLANTQDPHVDILLWVVHQLDERYMWSGRLDAVWLNVGENINAYPPTLREELAAHVLAILIRKSDVDMHILFNVLELSRDHICEGRMSYKLETFLHGYLPRLKKSEDDWDLCRRLDKWLAKVLKQAGFSKRSVVKYFDRPSVTERLWRYLKKL